MLKKPKIKLDAAEQSWF